MEIQFDKNKNLQGDLILTCTEFKQLFGYNIERQKKIENIFQVADKFKKIGCETMFVFGSFATSKEHPNDIDVCFDISSISKNVIEKNYSLLDRYERKRIREYFQVHIMLKETSDIEIIEWMKKDRASNKRGIIKVSLKDLPIYDTE